MRSTYTIRVSPAKIAIADLSESDISAAYMVINRINVPIDYRGQGYGRELLDKIMLDADEEGITLMLLPYASGGIDAGLGQADLEAWYARHGFLPGDQRYLVRYPGT